VSKVLIIEDELSTARPVQEALKINGIDAEIAQNGLQGLEMLKQDNYDLVLLDLKMPGLSGEEVLKEIRKADPFIDVVIYTNYSEFSDLKKLTNIGIDGYINKGATADLKELVNTIKQKLAPLDSEIIAKMMQDVPQDEDGL
jgi:DNA-binding response OmpR family regulator